MGWRPPLPALVAFTVVCLVPTGVVLRGEEPLVEVDGAYVRAADDGRGWTIGNTVIQYTLGAGVGVRAIADPLSDFDWNRTSGPDSFVTVNGQRVVIGGATTGLPKVNATEWWDGVRLDLIYELASVPLEITRSYACYPGSSVIETWTTFQTADHSVILSDLTNYAFRLPAGDVRRIRGVHVADEEGGSFGVETESLYDGQTSEIGAEGRSTEKYVPWFSIVDTDDPTGERQFFGSILWSGQWRFRVRRERDDIALQLGLPTFKVPLAAGASLETPHAVFGITNRALPQTSMAIRSFIEKGIRHGRPFPALTTYNSWFSYGTFVDEASMRSEMEMAAAMGIEQFVIDAGWWFDIDPDAASDFVKHWGNWQVDPDRFPSGLAAMTDYAHQLGMKLGIWVEPERVGMATVPQFAKERFLATVDGRYDPGVPNREAVSGQICLADSEARSWVLSKLYELLDDVHPDYLLWDNNYWVNCNRTSHGHGPEDGNFQHMRALDMVLADLRDRYPDMSIENCAGGGNRLSLGLMAYTDYGWVDDRSSPSTRVRHNLEGLSFVFPPGYLFTYAMGHQSEAFDASDRADLRLLMRSRMAGVLGATWTAAAMGPDTHMAIRNQIDLYKLIRPFVQDGSSILLTSQLGLNPDVPWSGWDAVELHVARSGEAVVLAFDTPDGPERTIIKPVGLQPNALYFVESADFGLLGDASGRDLMRYGVELRVSGVTHSHVLFFRTHQ